MTAGFGADFDDIDDTPTLDDLWVALTELAARVDALATDLAGAPNGRGAGATRYPTVADWVDGWWVWHVNRDTGGSQYSWCASWQDHPETVSRLTGLWQRWEQLQPEWAGMSAWWREADSQIPQLMGPTGALRHCRTGDNPRHKPAVPLPVHPLPAAAEDSDLPP